MPVIGCTCDVCRSEDQRDKRTRHSLLLEDEGRTLLVDTPPELRLQLIEANVGQVDAVFLSHEHADHTHGVDDLRIFTIRGGEPLPLFVAREFEEDLRVRFAYAWGGAKEQSGSVVPRLELHTFEDREPIRPAGFDLLPIALPHGECRSYGFRVGDAAILIDGKTVPEDAMALLEGLSVLVINALWFGSPHPGHFSIEEAIEVSRRLGVERTYLTHLAHRHSHVELGNRLPEGVFAAYDGLEISV